MRRITYVLIWLAVTATAVVVAAAAVGSVRDQVTEAPTAMVPTTSATAAPAPESSIATTTDESPSTTTSTTRPSATSTTTTAPMTTTTAPTESVPTTTTTTEPTTTTVPPATDIRSYDLIGGVVTVEVGSSTVNLAGASPKSGFSMDVEYSGPKKIEVEFESDRHESTFSGEFKDGEFVPEIEEESRDED